MKWLADFTFTLIAEKPYCVIVLLYSLCLPEDCYVQSSPLKPIPVFAPLVVDFMARCSKKPYSVQCLECGLLMETPACYRNHMLETQNQHVVSAFTEANVVSSWSL